MKDSFSSYHPLVNFLYFFMVLAFSMFFMHPVCLGISLFGAFTYSMVCNGKKAVSFSVKIMLPMLIAASLLNPAFNHAGGTILTYLPDGNPLTMESIIYGISAAVMLVAVVCWFTCYNSVMTSDKFIYLFGRVIPAMSLIISMSLRFVPRFKAQIKTVANAQKCIGRDVTNGSVMSRVKHGIRILSIMVTWSLENAVETADSMKSRGYGLPGRTAFSIYKMNNRDKKALIFISAASAYILAGALQGGLYYRYFPTVKGVWLEPYPVSLYLCYLALCITPVVINIREDRKWKAIQLKI